MVSHDYTLLEGCCIADLAHLVLAQRVAWLQPSSEQRSTILFALPVSRYHENVCTVYLGLLLHVTSHVLSDLHTLVMF